jgi:aspartate kinase
MSDIDGVYTADPRIVENAARLDELDHDTMVALGRHGARVLHPECVEYASRHQVALFAKATLGPRDDTGTIIRQNPARPACPVLAIAHRKQVVQITLGAGHDPAELFDAMASAGIFPTSLEADGRGARALVGLDDAHRRELLARRLNERFGEGVSIDNQGGTVTLVGPGLGEEAALIKKAWALVRSVGEGRADLRLGPMALTWTVATQDVEEVVRKSHREFIENWS